MKPLTPELIGMAVQLADSFARSDVECNLTPVEPYPAAWYDERSADAECRDDIALAVRYLDARGLLERKEGEPHIIRPIDEPCVAPDPCRALCRECKVGGKCMRVAA